MMFARIRALDSSENDSGLEQTHPMMRPFEELGDIGDEDALALQFAEDIVFMPPGSSPIQGKDEIVERYDRNRSLIRHVRLSNTVKNCSSVVSLQ